MVSETCLSAKTEGFEIEMSAYFILPAPRYPMTKISVTEMDEIFKDRKRRELVAYPIYYDDRECVWPTPPEGVSIVLDEES